MTSPTSVAVALVVLLLAAPRARTGRHLSPPELTATCGGPLLVSASGRSHPRCRRSLRRSRRRSVGWFTAAIASMLTAGPFAAAIVVVSAVSVARARPLVRHRAQHRRIARDLPDAVDLFVLVVQSGLTPRQAVDQLAQRCADPVGPGFEAVVQAMQRGEPLADAIDALVDTLGPPARPLAETIRSTDRTGLPLSAALEALALDNRLARRRLDEAAARRLPITLSFPLVTCTLPSFVLLGVAPMAMAALSSLGATPW